MPLPALHPCRTVRRRLRPGPRSILLIAVCLAIAAAVVAGLLQAQAHRERPALGLFTTLPIYWGEAAQLSDLLAEDREPHWVRRVLEEDYAVRPLDVLDAGKAGDSLTGLRFLLMAQPRALSPAENVVLDAWVRGGGRLLLFADPMLTEESSFAIGDKRRPHDVVLLSPILAHWGLDLQFDEEQEAGIRTVSVFGTELPVDLHGRLALRTPTGAAGSCRIATGGLAANCAIGRGRALILADAALLDAGASDPETRQAALSALVEAAFAGN